jgi:fructose-bisphosphate aldolase class I
MTDTTVMEDTVRCLTAPGKGLLAADESQSTIEKRLHAKGIECTEENRRFYRSMLVTTPGIADYIAGIIFHEETMDQRTDDGEAIPDACSARGIVPGIKVDRGTTELPGSESGEKITQGLDGLAERLVAHRDKGARFTKWRNVYEIGNGTPSLQAIEANAEVLARYAAIVQSVGMVPIVEPEVLKDGDHDIVQACHVNEVVLQAVFNALYRHKVTPELMVLKPSMAVAGKQSATASPDTVAAYTMQCLRRTVPAAVPAIHFLSGGQTPSEATANLNAINNAPGSRPWTIGFSYSRAIQDPVQEAWAGQTQNRENAQKAFVHRARLNSAARDGRYTPDMEEAA